MPRRAFCYLLLVAFVSGCATGPVDYPRTDSFIETDTQDTSIGREVAEWEQAHPGTNGFYPLIGGMDALGARFALIDAAERTIDAQYFLMKSDDAGLIFVMKLLEAADRGVRVRFLLDDVFTTVDDEVFLLLDQHPNVEMRLFNPIGRGGSKWLNYLGDFERANRRMHNKSFTVDNKISIVGGRNIAVEYFELKAGAEFRDADVLVVGGLAEDIGRNFDRFWNHSLSVPMEAFERRGDQDRDLGIARAEAADEFGDAMQSVYARALGSELVQDMLDDRVALFPATGEVISDNPEKLLNKISPDQQLLITRMAEVVASAESEVIVVTPYFIPGADGVEFFRSLTERGVRVIILTNSLASNNHIPVHGAYSRYRRSIIRAGVELYELRVNAVEENGDADRPPIESVTLHTKAIVVDRQHTFIGSLNLDPRAIDINTEMGVLADSDDMGRALAEPFMATLPGRAYQVVVDENDNLRWSAIIDGEVIVESSEPQSSMWRRIKAFMSKILPESQL